MGSEKIKKIAVITPYNNEDFVIIKRANESVISQENELSKQYKFVPNFICDHIIIVDGFDKNKNLNRLKCKKIELKKNYNNNGNTPRSIGTDFAISSNYDFIMYLDSDNWFLEGHIRSLFELIENKDYIGCSYRSFYTMDETKMSYIEDTDCLQKKFVDTSCYLIPQAFFKVMNIWHLIPQETSQWCDRIFFNNLLRHQCPIRFSERHTLAFRTLYDVHYTYSNLELPKNVKISKKINEKAVNFFSDENNKKDFLKNFGFWWKSN